jgi:hypothetical protein
VAVAIVELKEEEEEEEEEEEVTSERQGQLVKQTQAANLKEIA